LQNIRKGSLGKKNKSDHTKNVRKDLYIQSKVRKSKNKENVPPVNLRKYKKKKNIKHLYDNYDIHDIIKETEAEDSERRISYSHKK